MKKEVFSGKVHPQIKSDMKKIAEIRGITSSDLQERVFRSFIKQQKEKGVI